MAMGQFRTLSAALAAALCVAPAAFAGDEATTLGTADLQDRAGIEAAGEVIFQDILITPTIPLTTTSTGSASVSVMGDTTVSLAVPEAVDVSLAGGEESVMVLTALDGEQAGVLGISSLVAAGEMLSVDIGGEISIKAEDLAPGEYRGLLVVVAQYN